MAGAMRKMAVYLGLVEDEDLDGEYDDDDGYDERAHVVRRSDEPTLRVTRPDEVAERRPPPRREAVDAARRLPHHDGPPAQLQRGADHR